MRFSQLPGITLRHAKDTERASYALMLHADYVRQVVTGIYAYLHLGQCSPQKIKAMLREATDRIGGSKPSQRL